MNIKNYTDTAFSEKLIIIAGILIITHITTNYASKFIKKALNINYAFFEYAIKIFIYFVGLSLAATLIPALKSIALSIFAGSGIVALAIGFASQQAVSNVISGLFLGIFKPFKIGDSISIKNISGQVIDITLRHTIIKTAENSYILVPNSLMNSEIIQNNSWSEKNN